MRTHLHRWLPTAIALLALVVALGGPAAAGKKINGKSILKGTVASKQLKNLGVQGTDVRDGTLTGAKVADGSLTTQDVADASMTGVDVADSSLGAADLAAASVGASELVAGSVTGQALDGSGTLSIDFPSINAHTCTNLTRTLPVAEIGDGSLSDDVILATPDASYTENFTYTLKSNGPLNVVIRMCNVSVAAADPDGSGGPKPWQWAAIDIG